MNGVGISLAGMHAATQHIANSANNVANAQTTSSVGSDGVKQAAYQPTNVMQSSIQPTGGVKTRLEVRDPATVPMSAPNNPGADAEGMVDVPNVNLDEEMVTQKMATYDYKANLKALQVTDDIMQSLMDVMA